MSLPLTEEQRAIVESPAESRQLVLASPGTGKTHTLVARMIHLVDEVGLRPGGELLILSFSRTAVGEMRRRLLAAGGNAAYVRAFTFDSFATRLLTDTQPDGSWQDLGYEGRIKRASKWISTDERAKEYISRFKHVLVDEIQDIVGERIRLTQAIIQAVGGGFTVFGDPAQGIYGFSAGGDQDSPWALVRWLRETMDDGLREVVLTKNLRTGPGTRAAMSLWAAPALLGLTDDYGRDDGIDYEKILDGLIDDIIDLPTLGNVQAACSSLSARAGKTAILTRKNVEALLISRELWRRGVPHSLQREAMDRVIPSCVGVALRGLETNRVRRSTLQQFDNADKVWDLLKRIEPAVRDNLDVERLWRSVHEGNIPDDLSSGEEAGLVVSTIHKAKGREFDAVILAVDPEELYKLAIGDDLPEACRLLFVALTRSRDEGFHLDPPSAGGYRRDSGGTGRWVRAVSGVVEEVEVFGHESRSGEPPGWPAPEPTISEIQNYLECQVKPGDEVELRLNGGDQSAPRYSIHHKDRQIGSMNDDFHDSLLHAVRRYNGGARAPVALTALFVDSIDTVAGSRSIGRQAGLGTSGLWLRPRVYGLGKMNGGST